MDAYFLSKTTTKNLMFFVSIFTGTARFQIVMCEVWTPKNLEHVEFALVTIDHIG